MKDVDHHAVILGLVMQVRQLHCAIETIYRSPIELPDKAKEFIELHLHNSRRAELEIWQELGMPIPEKPENPPEVKLDPSKIKSIDTAAGETS